MADDTNQSSNKTSDSLKKENIKKAEKTLEKDKKDPQSTQKTTENNKVYSDKPKSDTKINLTSISPETEIIKKIFTKFQKPIPNFVKEGRILLKEGELLWQIKSGSFVDHFVWLFNDILIVSIADKKTGKHVLKHTINLETSQIDEKRERNVKKTPKIGFSFKLMTPQAVFTIGSDSNELLTSWLTSLLNAIINYHIYIKSPIINSFAWHHSLHIGTVFSSVLVGDVEESKRLLTEDTCNNSDIDGNTPLHLSAFSGSEVLVKYLIDLKADPSIKDKHNYTPLLLSCREGRSSIIPSLLTASSVLSELHNPLEQLPNETDTESNGQDSRPLNSLDPVALCLASISSESSSILNQLLTCGYPIEDRINKKGLSYLHIVASDYNVLNRDVMFETILDFAPGLVSLPDYSGMTPLHYSAKFAREKISSFLIDHGAKINIRDFKGNTPLHYSSKLSISRHLVFCGAIYTLKNCSDQSCLDLHIQRFAPRTPNININTNNHILTPQSLEAQLKASETQFHNRPIVTTDEHWKGDQEWISDDSSNCCLVCSEEFTFVHRKHHCRRCGLLLCSSCTSKKVINYRLSDNKRSERVCNSCYNVCSNLDGINRRMVVLRKQKESNKKVPYSEPKKDTRAQLFEYTKNIESTQSLPASLISKAQRENISTTSVLNDKLGMRGEKIEELANRSEDLANDSKNFVNVARDLQKKFENKKWYDF